MKKLQKENAEHKGDGQKKLGLRWIELSQLVQMFIHASRMWNQHSKAKISKEVIHCCNV